MTYTVKITPGTEAAILAQARYIAIDQAAPLNATRWLQRMFDAADTLSEFPRRCALAPESARRPYEIRQMNVDGHMLLFTILEETSTIWIIGYRHGRMLPREGELPQQPPAEPDASDT